MKNIIQFATVCLFLLTACATPSAKLAHPIEPTKDDLSKFQYGSAPINYKTSIKEYVSDSLIDPDSAKFTRFSIPKKDWLSDNQLGGKTYIGWLVCVDVNAKNKFGGYAGRQPYSFIFNGEKIIFAQSEETIKYVADGWAPPNKYPIECDYSGT